jgi:uncharacterized protein
MQNQASPHKTRDLVLYFVLAYAISWSIGIPLALKHQGILALSIPDWMHYFVAYGPLLSAVLVTLFSEGGAGLKKLAARMGMWKVGPT